MTIADQSAVIAVATETGFWLNAQGHTAEAIAFFEAGLSVNSSLATLWLAKAVGFKQLRRFEDALDCLETAVTNATCPNADPFESDLTVLAYRQQAQCLEPLGDDEEAALAFEDALASEPDDEHLRLAWICCLRRSGSTPARWMHALS